MPGFLGGRIAQLARSWGYLRAPSTLPGRRYSYHRAILLVGGLVWLYLFLPAEWTPELAHRKGLAAAVLVVVCILADVGISVHGWYHRRKAAQPTGNAHTEAQ